MPLGLSAALEDSARLARHPGWVCPLSPGEARLSCGPRLPPGSSLPGSLVTTCVHGQGCRRRLPGMRSGSWGWPVSPFSRPLSALGVWLPAPAMCWGHGRQAPLTPCRALPRRRVPVGVRLPVTLSGSSSPPGKAAERLGGRGRRPRLWFCGPAVPEGLSGPGPASGCLGVSWGVGGVSEPRCRACARGPGPWAETRCVLSLGGLVQVPKMSVTPLTTCGCCL